MGSDLWTRATRRPLDFVAICGAAALSFFIVINAVYLQSGSLPAPFVTSPAQQQAAIDSRLTPSDAPAAKPADPLGPTHAVGAIRGPQSAGARQNDPIGDLISSTSRIMAVQRALSDYGYGQIRSSGMLDNATNAAIEKFEREHNLPVTGKISDRLIADLTTLTGHSIE